MTKKIEDNIIDGYSLQMGWSFYVMKEISKNLFLVLTPDFNENPFEDETDDLSCALSIMQQQTILLSILHLDGELCNCFQKIIIDSGISESDYIFMNRSTPDQKDSGWYISPIEEEERKGELVSIYAFELLGKKDSLIQSLGLLTGCLVIYKNNKLLSISDKDEKDLL